MRNDRDPNAGYFEREPFDSRSVSESMLAKLFQAERDGERFWQGVSKRIQRLRSDSKQVDFDDDVVMERGSNFMTPMAKIQIGFLAATILLSMLVSMLILTMKSPSAPLMSAKSTATEAVSKSTVHTLETTEPVKAIPAVVHVQPKPNVAAAALTAVDSIVTSTVNVALRNTAMSHRSKLRQQKRLSKESKKNIIAATNRLEKMADQEFADKKFLNLNAEFNKSGYGRLSINGEVTSGKVGPREIADALPRIQQELHDRVAFIAPRIGFIRGVLYIEHGKVSESFEYRNLKELEWAFGQFTKQLDTLETRFRRKTKTDPVKNCEEMSVKRINELFQRWADEAMQNGGATLRVPRDKKEKFSTIIDKKSFENFAKTGTFILPSPSQLYLVETKIQKLNANRIKQKLSQDVVKVDLFRNSREANSFRDDWLKWKRENASSIKGRSGHLESRELLKEMLQEREDLMGLPIVMGDDCKMEAQQATSMNEVSRRFGTLSNRLNSSNLRNSDVRAHELAKHVHTLDQSSDVTSVQKLRTVDQMLQVEGPEVRHSLINVLGKVQTPSSASLLSCYAKFDADEGVRMAATKTLSGFAPEFYRNRLLEGLEYPWGEAVKHSVEAIVRLNDTGAIPQLVNKLKSKDPRSPWRTKDGGFAHKRMVAINHMKNCMLCHADSPSTRDLGRAPVPEWDRPPPPRYYQATPSGLVARADRTYLRQDFSVSLETKDRPNHWPARQRFDFVVQEKELDYAEFLDLRNQYERNSSEYRNAIIFALQMLTDETPDDNSYENWFALTSEYRRSTP